MGSNAAVFKDDALWYKDAVIYELHVKTFCDSNADGIGDFAGLTEKIPYLRSLGITALWLLPFYPSPLRDDGYDIADYMSIHPDYGTMKDFRRFLTRAHKAGLRVITELVLNHTSNEHPWFQQARRAKPNSKARNMYVWSDSPERYKDARIIFQDFETSNWTWDPVANSYYWHRFYSHQPDLNFDSPALQRRMFDVLDFWLEMGVDGVRLDAVPYLFERDGTNCENLPETYAFLRKLRGHIDEKFKNKMVLAEANQWPEDARAYFGDGDMCNMAFHFPLMPRLFMAIQMEDSFPINDILQATPPIPDGCQWATFLRNHDELTLEMVTDEERDYMYKVYAQDPRAKINLGIRRRLAPLLMNNRRKIELMNMLLFSLPGTPVIYYGDEIGMGDNYYLGDRNGVRTPMQWAADRNAGFSAANPQQLFLPVNIDPEYHFEAVNVENQERNLSSLLWWTKRVIAMRKKYRAFSRGGLEMISCHNPRVLTFVRTYERQRVLVVINLSRFTQVATLELRKYEGCVPQELFSRNAFPQIKHAPYILTMGPYDHYWLLLEDASPAAQAASPAAAAELPQITLLGEWARVFSPDRRETLEEDVLPVYLKKCRWFGGKSRVIRRVRVVEDALISRDLAMHLLVLEVSYNSGPAQWYTLPLAVATQPERLRELQENHRSAVVARLQLLEQEALLYDAMHEPLFRQHLLQFIYQRKRSRTVEGELAGVSSVALKKKVLEDTGVPASHLLGVEQSNTSAIFGKTIILKLLRRLEEGEHPERELLQRLAEQRRFSGVPALYGSLEYQTRGSKMYVIAVCEQCLEHVSDAWRYVTDVAGQYFEQILTRREALQLPAAMPNLLAFTPECVPPVLPELTGSMFLEMAALLGKRTGELHRALAGIGGAAFAPEPFSLLYQKSVVQSMKSLLSRNLQALSQLMDRVPAGAQQKAKQVLDQQPRISRRMDRLLEKKLSAMKIRIHGDYHLGQVLYTGRDFYVIDFEGEPARTLSERRLKRSVFRDVAGMIRSFHYAAYAALLLRPSMRQEDVHWLQDWIAPWFHAVAGTFLSAYLTEVRGQRFIPADPTELQLLLQTFVLEKAVYELGYELNNRPHWLMIPLEGILYAMEHQP